MRKSKFISLVKELGKTCLMINILQIGDEMLRKCNLWKYRSKLNEDRNNEIN